MRNPRWPLLVVCGLIWTAIPGPPARAEDDLFGSPQPAPIQTAPAEAAPAEIAPESAAPMEANPSVFDLAVPAPDAAGMWVPEPDRPHRVFYFSTEYLLAWGKGPGDNLIGAEQYRNQSFFPGFPVPFPQQSTGAFNDLFHQGVMGRFGWDNADGSGFQFSGFDVFGRQQQKGPGFVSGLGTLASIPLDDGAGGTLVSPKAPFDRGFLQTYDQRIFGGDIDAYLPPFFTRPSFRLRFLWGAKYLNIRESFAVQAAESGLNYFIDLNTGAIVPGTIQNIGLAPNELSIRSQTTSQLIGPQIGVRYDLVSGWLNIWGQSRFSAAANMENLQIAGQGVTNTFQLSPPPPVGPAFQQSSSSTHVSPVFNTSVYLDLPLLSIVPLINQLAVFNQAKFRIGYNFLLVGEIARPANIIVYKTPIPELRSDRTTFFLNTLSLGVNWTY